MQSLKQRLSRFAAVYLTASIAFMGVLQPAQAAMIGSEQVLAQATGAERSQLNAWLDRTDVQDRLQALGVSADDAKARVAALTDAEAQALVQQVDTAPAGGIIDAIIFVFLVLLVTDILGFTKVFPFTRAAR